MLLVFVLVFVLSVHRFHCHAPSASKRAVTPTAAPTVAQIGDGDADGDCGGGGGGGGNGGGGGGISCSSMNCNINCASVLLVNPSPLKSAFLQSVVGKDKLAAIISARSTKSAKRSTPSESTSNPWVVLHVGGGGPLGSGPLGGGELGGGWLVDGVVGGGAAGGEPGGGGLG
jgi:hypothetical protein